MKTEEKDPSFWKKHWDQKSTLTDPMDAAGWGKRDTREYLYDVDDIVKKLELTTDDKFLNIGCGNGLFEIVMGYWLKDMTAVDFSEAMLRKAIENNQKIHPHIKFQTGDVKNLQMKSKTFTKVLCNSVIQYLNDLEEVQQGFECLYRLTEPKARVLIAANPDLTRQEEFFKGYDKLNLTKEEIEVKKNANRKSLWTMPKDVLKIAQKVGFKGETASMSPSVWQSCYMYDLILWRD